MVVTFLDATLVTKRALPLTWAWAGLSPAGSRQLRLAHRYSFIAVDLHHLLLAGRPAHLCENTQEPTVSLETIIAVTTIGERAIEEIILRLGAVQDFPDR